MARGVLGRAPSLTVGSTTILVSFVWFMEIGWWHWQGAPRETFMLTVVVRGNPVLSMITFVTVFASGGGFSQSHSTSLNFLSLAAEDLTA